MFMSVVALLGYQQYIFGGDRDDMREVLDYLTRADELNIFPSFPQDIPTAWKKVYPLLTMLNAIAMCGRADYLNHPVDWLAEAKALLAQIPWDDRVHMSEYYLVALYNLGRLRDQVPDLDAYLAEVVAVLDFVDPGGNFFPNGIAYPYIIELAMQTGRMDLIRTRRSNGWSTASPATSGTAVDRANSAFPVSYVLNVLGESVPPIVILTPRARFDGSSAIAWVIDHSPMAPRKKAPGST